MKRPILVGIALTTALTMMTACSAVSAVTAPDASSSPDVVYPEGYGPDATDAPDETDAPVDEQPDEPTPEAGSLESPFPKGYTVTISHDDEDYYSVRFDLIAADGDKKVAAANQFNDKAPKGYHYVIVKATFTGLSSEAVSPGVEMYDWQIADQDGNLYQSTVVVTDGESVSGAPDLYKGQKFSGEEVYTVADTADALFMTALGSYIVL